jgi:hypothetical protein
MKNVMRTHMLRAGAVVLAAGLLATSGQARLAPPDDLARFEGNWLRSERERDDSLRGEAIEKLAADMPFWARGIARAMMNSSMRPPESYTIRLTATGLSITEGDDQPIPAFVDPEPDAGEPETNGPDGTELARIMARMPDGSLLQQWRHGEGSHGTTRWEVTEARRLKVSIIAYDTRLSNAGGEPRPIRYATSYSPAADANRSTRAE